MIEFQGSAKLLLVREAFVASELAEVRLGRGFLSLRSLGEYMGFNAAL